MGKPYLSIGKHGGPKSEMIAFIQGGKHNKEFIWLNEGEDDGDDLTASERTALMKIVRSKLEKKGKFTDEYLNEHTNSILKKFEPTERLYEIDIKDGKVVPFPTVETRQCAYAAAPSGSGKSYWAKNYAKMYNKAFPSNKVFLFSKVSNDVSLKGIKNLIPIILDQELVDDEITCDELADSLVIFDDTDCITNAEILKAVNQLKDSILETGRHHRIHCLITSHLISDYKKTRTVLNESHILTVYPSSGSAHQIKSVLAKYWGLDKKDIDKIFRLNSRWVSIRKNFPQMVLSEHKVYLIGSSMNND
jgi:hypothetical protein